MQHLHKPLACKFENHFECFLVQSMVLTLLINDQWQRFIKQIHHTSLLIHCFYIYISMINVFFKTTI